MRLCCWVMKPRKWKEHIQLVNGTDNVRQCFIGLFLRCNGFIFILFLYVSHFLFLSFHWPTRSNKAQRTNAYYSNMITFTGFHQKPSSKSVCPFITTLTLFISLFFNLSRSVVTVFQLCVLHPLRFRSPPLTLGWCWTWTMTHSLISVMSYVLNCKYSAVSKLRNSYSKSIHAYPSLSIY